jgi:hypothetical protein
LAGNPECPADWAHRVWTQASEGDQRQPAQDLKCWRVFRT